MPKLDEELTDKVMKGLSAPPKGNVLHYDPILKGFAARVTHKGARAFVLVYRFGGEERRDTIGEFPAWRAKAAREVAEDWRRDARKGIDPRGEPEPDNLLFRLLAEQFLEHGRTKRGRLLRPATKREYSRALLGYATGLHDRAVTDIRRADAAELIRTAASERGATTAMRTRAAGSRFYSWLIANGYVESNPFTGTEGYATAKGERTLHDPELAALWTATAEPTDYHLILRTMLWTGCRRSEAGGMRWSELVNGAWLIPGTRTKNHRSLALPLPRQAVAALEGWHRLVGRDLVFGRGPNGFQAWSKSKERLDRRLGFDRSWDLHDCRRTVETRMAELGLPKDHVNRVLNHAMAPITAHYDRYDYLPEKRAALQRWADELERITAGTPSVVTMPRSAS